MLIICFTSFLFKLKDFCKMLYFCHSKEPFDLAQDKLHDEESVITKLSDLQNVSGLRFFALPLERDRSE
ncbi:MAG: hypothetical protein ACE5HI_08980 [bacterium]